MPLNRKLSRRSDGASLFTIVAKEFNGGGETQSPETCHRPSRKTRESVRGKSTRYSRMLVKILDTVTGEITSALTFPEIFWFITARLNARRRIEGYRLRRSRSFSSFSCDFPALLFCFEYTKEKLDAFLRNWSKWGRIFLFTILKIPIATNVAWLTSIC